MVPSCPAPVPFCGYINIYPVILSVVISIEPPRSPAIRSMTGCFGVLAVSGESKHNIPSPVVANKSNIDDSSLWRFGKRPHFYDDPVMIL